MSVIVYGFKKGNSERARSMGVGYQVSPTLSGQEGGNMIPAIAIIAIQGTLIGRSEKAGPQGLGASCEGVMYTLNTADRHGVAIIAENAEECMNQLTLSWEEAPAKPSQSQDSEKDWMIRVATSVSPISLSLRNIFPNGLSGKTSPASCHLQEDGTLLPSSGRWMRSGMGMRGECLTLNTSEHPTIRGLSLSDEGVSSLSEIVEVGNVPQRFYLTPKACAGILRRAEKRGKDLPPLLRKALEERVNQS